MLFLDFAAAADRILRALHDDERVHFAADRLASAGDDAELSLTATWLVHGALGPRGRRSAPVGSLTALRAYALSAAATVDEPGTLDHEIFRACRAMAGETIATIRMLLEAQARAAGRPVTASSAPTLSDIDRFITTLATARSSAGKAEILASIWSEISPAEVEWLLRILSHPPVSPLLFPHVLARAFDRPLESLRLAMMLRGDAGELAVAARRGPIAEPSPRPFQFLPPMRAATLALDDLDAEATTAVRSQVRPVDLTVEELLPGERVQAHVWHAADAPGSARSVAIFTTSGSEISRRVADVVRELESFPDGTVIDAQLVMTGVTDELSAATGLAQRLGPHATVPVVGTIVLVAFDLLVDEGKLLIARPIEERRRRLHELAARQRLRVVRVAEARNWGLLQQMINTAAANRRRLLLKSARSLYEPGERTGSWLKVRTAPAMIRAVIRYVRFQREEHEPECELTLGVWLLDPNGERRLVNICRAPACGSPEQIAELQRRLAGLRLQRFGTTWEVRPEIVCEVLYDAVHKSGRTAAGYTLRGARIRAFDESEIMQRDPGTVGEIEILMRSARIPRVTESDEALPWYIPDPS